MFKNLTVVVLAVLLSTTANAQAKKRAKKKPAAPATTEAAAEPTPAPEAPAAEPAASEPAPTAVASSSASGKISQFNWQPAAGQSGAQIRLNYGMYSTETDPSTQKTDVTDMNIPLSYHYGITDTNSVGVSTDFGNMTSKTGSAAELKTTGLGDIFIQSRNYSPMGGGKLLYGVSLGISTAKAKFADDSPAQDGTRASGGMSLPIYVGYEADMGGSYAGVRLDYTLKMERQVEGTGDPKLKDGNTMDLLGYYESGTDSHWNAYIGFGTVADTKLEVGALSATSKGYSSVPLGASWGTYLSPGMLLAVHYDGRYVMEVDQGAGSKTKAHLRNQLGARARWEF